MHTFIRANEIDGGRAAEIAAKILEATKAPQLGDVAHKAFAKLGLDFELPATVRVHTSLSYTLGTNEEFGKHPALVIPLTDGQERFAALELLYLSPDGSPAPVVDSRQIYWLNEQEPGVFMALHQPEDGLWGVACGICEALAANYYTGVPMAAVCSPADLAAFQIPHGIERLAIFANHRCASEAIALQARARSVGIRAEIYTPSEPNPNWLSEFALRGAFPIDEVADSKAALDRNIDDSADGDLHE